MQIDDRQIVVGIRSCGGGKCFPAIGFVELRVGIETAQQTLDALPDQFMVVGHKKLHDVSASRACPLWTTAVVGSRCTSILVYRIMAGYPAFAAPSGGAARLSAG